MAKKTIRIYRKEQSSKHQLLNPGASRPVHLDIFVFSYNDEKPQAPLAEVFSCFDSCGTKRTGVSKTVSRGRVRGLPFLKNAVLGSGLTLTLTLNSMIDPEFGPGPGPVPNPAFY